jgi:hypothetical protein
MYFATILSPITTTIHLFCILLMHSTSILQSTHASIRPSRRGTGDGRTLYARRRQGRNPWRSRATWGVLGWGSPPTQSSGGVGWTPSRLLFQSREEQGDLGRGIWGGGRTESARCWGGRRPVSSGCGGGGRRRTLAGGARTVQGEGRRENARTRGAERGGRRDKKERNVFFHNQWQVGNFLPQK